jgi:hypothetical protein
VIDKHQQLLIDRPILAVALLLTIELFLVSF